MSELCIVNRPIRPVAANSSPLNQIIALSDTRSNIESYIGSNIILDVDFEERIEAILLSALFGTEVKEEQQSKQAQKKVNKSNVAKQANLANEILDYIHITKCRHLFSLA